MPRTSPYSPFSTATSIRLLDLDPLSEKGNIKGTFHELDLENSTHNSAYTALSYRWGDEDDNQQITIDGHIVTVRRNLYDFLNWAKNTAGRVNDLWIDA